MKNFVWSGMQILMLALAPLAAFDAQAQSLSTRTEYAEVNNINKVGQIGAGVQLGSLTGVNINYWNSQTDTWNAGIAADNGNTAVLVGHMWMFPGAFTTASGGRDFVPFIGVGALMAWGDHDDYLKNRTENFALAAQVPVGVEFLPRSERFGIFAELQPSLELTPDSYAFLTGDLGARFYF